jgi:glutamine cyclotransferase
LEGKNHVKDLYLKFRFVYSYSSSDPNKLPSLQKKLSLPQEISEGWGITNTNDELIVSDGTDKIYFVDPDLKNFKVNRIISVKDSSGNYVANINELEYAYGYIFANIWMSNKMMIIDPSNGKVVRYSIIFLF